MASFWFFINCTHKPEMVGLKGIFGFGPEFVPCGQVFRLFSVGSAGRDSFDNNVNSEICFCCFLCGADA